MRGQETPQSDPLRGESDDHRDVALLVIEPNGAELRKEIILMGDSDE